MALTYPVYSNAPLVKEEDSRALQAKRMGYSQCLQWKNSAVNLPSGVEAERPNNPYLTPFNGALAEAWEDGWSTAVAVSKGRGF